MIYVAVLQFWTNWTPLTVTIEIKIYHFQTIHSNVVHCQLHSDNQNKNKKIIEYTIEYETNEYSMIFTTSIDLYFGE